MGVESQIYSAVTDDDGQVITVHDYDPAKHVEIYCPNCLPKHHEEQKLYFSDTERRFFHRHTDRACYHDGRIHDRDHHEISQAIHAKLSNDTRYDVGTPDTALPNADNPQYYPDVHSKLPYNDALSGAAFEVQHNCTHFRNRITRKISAAHDNNYCVYVVFSVPTEHRTWFEQKMTEKYAPMEAGVFVAGDLSLGDPIMPRRYTAKRWSQNTAL